MVMPRKLTDEQVQKIRQLWEEGYSRAELAERFNVSVGCIGYQIKKKNQGAVTSVSYMNRKYHLLIGERTYRDKVFYHLRESIKCLGYLSKSLGKRFPEYTDHFGDVERLCTDIINGTQSELEKRLVYEWELIEQDCKKKWREYEKEYRKLTGRSSMDRLDRF